ncbi:MAG: TIGR01777 family protein [Blastopirellula sp.]|nr:MAG: TIGR01777 family protein [Blastopirellula sp.]
METSTLVFRSEVPVSVEKLFQWHQSPGALSRLMPPWENARLISTDGSIEPGSSTTLQIKLGPVRLNWVAQHTEFSLNHHFQDIQLSGPFSFWKHDHRFESSGENRSFLEDRIEYRLPGGILGGFIAGQSVTRKIERMFRYRHDTMIEDLKSYSQSIKANKMNIAISGSKGLIGSALWPYLENDQHQLTRLVRSKPAGNEIAREITWNYQSDVFDAEKFADIDSVIHLAGESIADGRWTKAKKQRIVDSRFLGTKFLCEKLAKLPNPPKTFICASAIGYYGETGNHPVAEDAACGDLFLSDICRQWEEATQSATDAGIRVVNLRFGVILSPKGGALAKMLLPFSLGAGGKIGNGRQFWSWISLDDVISAIYFLLNNTKIAGPTNIVAPHAVTNLEFTKTLGKVLRRPTIFPMPHFAARVALGEMVDDLLFASTRVVPQKLLDAGFEFRHPDLEPALRHLLGKQLN